MDTLDHRYLKLLGFIVDSYLANDPASLRECAKLCKLSAKGVLCRLVKIREAGLITWDNGKARTIRPTFLLEVVA